MEIEEVNQKLRRYVGKSDLGVYARLTEEGMIKLEGYFNLNDLTEISKILGVKEKIEDK